MSDRERKMWPYQPRLSIVATLIISFTLLIAIVILRATVDLPSQDSERMVLLGIFLISLVPVLLLLVDTMVERGGTVEYRGVSINFSQAQRMEMQGPTIPANIGVPGQAVGDSDATETPDALRQATTSESIINDAPYVEVTENGRFQSLVSRLTVLNSIIGTLVQRK